MHRQLDESEIVKFLMQLKILLIKNATIFFRKKKILFFMFATPFLVAFMLSYIDGLAQDLNDKGVVSQRIRPQDMPLPRCVPKLVKSNEPVPPCATVGYTILGDHSLDQQPKVKRIHHLMDIFSKAHSLERGKDV